MSDERRRASRFDSQVPVRVFSRQLTVKVGGLELTTTNVSLSGLQLVCPEMLYFGIKEQVDSGIIEAEIDLPASRIINVRCDVAYASEIGDEMLLGAHIASFDEGGADAWTAFIEALERGSP